MVGIGCDEYTRNRSDAGYSQVHDQDKQKKALKRPRVCNVARVYSRFVMKGGLPEAGTFMHLGATVCNKI
jgi:hypothetical protein